MEFKEENTPNEPQIDIPEEELTDNTSDDDPADEAVSEPRRVTVSFLISVLCVVMAATVLLTYLVTNNANRYYYGNQLAQQQSVINQLRGESDSELKDRLHFADLELLAQIFDHYSYYANELDQEALMEAVIHAYVAATGDEYAAYFTEEEYAEYSDSSNGSHVGIGVSITNNVVTVDGVSHKVLEITSVFPNSTANAAGLQMGDCIFSLQTGDGYQSVSELGFGNALAMLQGEIGTAAEFRVFRPVDGRYEVLDFSIIRADYETVSVSFQFAEANKTVGIVRIKKFNRTTPHQLKAAILALQAQGAKHFIFDLRNNPGGEMQSIKSSLSYFLQEGDLILQTINRDGQITASHYVEEVIGKGDAAAFNVSKAEIGMFANLDMVVLCNEDTASAAEVFTATMRDYELATVVGSKTYGKGVLQHNIPLSMFGNYTGYIHLTTYAYVTKCGVTYHEIGIQPHVSVPLSEEAQKYHLNLLPQSLDNQLQAAIAQFK